MLSPTGQTRKEYLGCKTKGEALHYRLSTSKYSLLDLHLQPLFFPIYPTTVNLTMESSRHVYLVPKINLQLVITVSSNAYFFATGYITTLAA